MAGADRSRPAWRQAYRAVDHGFAKGPCKTGRISKFPKAVQDSAAAFVNAQGERHSADHDPCARFTRSGTLTLLAQTETALRAFRKVSLKDRRAFAVSVTLKER